MNIGMLWFDNYPYTNMETKVKWAAVYFRRKYGVVPTVCFVHPCMLLGAIGGKVGPIEIRTSRSVLPNHFWIGVEDRSINRRFNQLLERKGDSKWQ